MYPLQIKILQATGLPQYLSNFVFCQYAFWDQPEPIIVAPEVDPSSSSPNTKDPHCMVVFDSCKVKPGREEDKEDKSIFNVVQN